MNKKLSLIAVLTAMCCLHCLGQVNINVTSPSATDFVKYERIPVSYFNGLPNIEIPLYTVETKDLKLPIHLSYYASGIRVNQYPTCVGLGWNLNAGGCITRVVNGIPDETCWRTLKDETGITFSGLNPGHYFSSEYMAVADWTSEEKLQTYAYMAREINYDMEPDEFVINAYGISGSVYFDRDADGNLQSHVKSNNGESFRVDFPVMKHNPKEITFSGGGDEPLKSYRIYELFYEFTVTKNDGTKLIFGGDDDCIEFYTEKKPHGTRPYLKTWPSAWMLREVISPNGTRMTLEYMRNGSPIIISDVRTDVVIYELDGSHDVWPSQGNDRGISFVVKHPVYLHNIKVDDLAIDFSYNPANDLNTIGSRFVFYMQTKGFSSNIVDHVCYDKGSSGYIAYAPHNYSQCLGRMLVRNGDEVLHSFGFAYTTNKNERLKLTIVAIRGNNGIAEQKYNFRYNPLKLPEYNSPVTDNWGYWNDKNYRSINIDDGFFEYRSANEYYTKAEVLTGISYPTGGTVSFDYELNDYSKIATQVPDFKILEKGGTAGGLRIKRISYATDSRTRIHSFEYKNDDGTSSGILSGIPIYVAEGRQYVKYAYSSWLELTYFSCFRHFL